MSRTETTKENTAKNEWKNINMTRYNGERYDWYEIVKVPKKWDIPVVPAFIEVPKCLKL